MANRWGSRRLRAWSQNDQYRRGRWTRLAESRRPTVAELVTTLAGGGAVDGVPLKMAVVVMKKDFCLYDFSYFAPPGGFSRGISDFEGYLNGFKTE